MPNAVAKNLLLQLAFCLESHWWPRENYLLETLSVRTIGLWIDSALSKRHNPELFSLRIETPCPSPLANVDSLSEKLPFTNQKTLPKLQLPSPYAMHDIFGSQIDYLVVCPERSDVGLMQRLLRVWLQRR